MHVFPFQKYPQVLHRDSSDVVEHVLFSSANEVQAVKPRSVLFPFEHSLGDITLAEVSTPLFTTLAMTQQTSACAQAWEEENNTTKDDHKIHR